MAVIKQAAKVEPPIVAAVPNGPPGLGMEFVHALNDAATALQQAATSEAEVYAVASQQIISLGLRGALSLLDASGENLIVRSLAMPGPWQVVLQGFEAVTGVRAAGFAMPLDRLPEFAQVLDSGEALYSTNISALLTNMLPERARGIQQRVLQAFASQPAIFAPLMGRGKPVGLLNVLGADLAPDDVPAMQAFANHIAMALDNASLIADLRQSEERYRQLVTRAPDAIFVEADGRIVFANPAAVHLLGLDNGLQMLGRPLADFAHPDSRSQVIALLHEVIDRAADALVEGLFIRPDGREVAVEASAMPFDYMGRPAVQVVMHDVSERRRADKVRAATLRISEAAHTAHRLDDLYRLIHDVVLGLMPAQNFYIALYDEQTQTLSYPYAVDEQEPEWWSHRIGKGLTAYVIQHGRSVFATPEVFEELVASGDVELFGVPSVDWLGVPLSAAGKIIGVVVVQTYTEDVRLTEDDLQMLEFVSTQVAMAVERKRAEEDIRRRDAILEAIAFAAEQFLRQPSWHEAAEPVLERLGRAADISRIYLYENVPGPGKELVALSRFGWEAPGVESVGSSPSLTRVSYDPNEFLRWSEVLGRGQACYGHVREFPANERALLEGRGIRSLVLVPITASGAWWGFLGCDECLRERDWSAAEVDALQAAANTLGAAIYRQTTESELRRRAAESAALYDTARDLAGPEDLPALLRTIVERAVRLIGASAGDMFLFEEAQQELVLLTSTDERLPAGGRLKLGEGLSGRAAQTRQAQMVADYSQWEHRVKELEQVKPRAMLAVPMLYGGALVGVLGLHESSEVKREFSEADVRLLSLIASLAAGAIHNARLLDATRRHLGELEAMSNISTALRGAPTLEQIVPTLLDQTLKALETEHGLIWLYDSGADVLRRASARGWFTKMGAAEVKPGEGLAGLVFATGQPYFTANFADDPNVRDSAREQVPAGFGGACVPFRTSAEMIVGGMYVAVQHPRELTREEIHLLTAVADLGGNAIQRSRLHEQTERRLRRLTALHSVETAISASLDLHVTLNVVLDHVTTQLGVDAADVLLLSSISQTLEYAAGRGFRTGGAPTARLRLGEGYAGRAALDRRVIAVNDLRTRRTDVLRSPLYGAEGFQVMYAVPLMAKGRVVGVLEIFHRSTLSPDPEWHEFLETLAQQAAIAIDDAELFANLQRSNVELSLAYDTTLEGWARALELRDSETEGHTRRVVEVAERLGKAMGLDEMALGQLRRGALLHDIGKVGIPDSILRKPGPLTPEEWEVMRMHPTYAYNLISPIAYLRQAVDIPYCHHEWWDGTGYPRGLKGEEIPLPARIFAVVDTWDALLSDRPYRRAWTVEQVRGYIQGQAGSQLDPRVVETFLALRASDYWAAKTPLGLS